MRVLRLQLEGGPQACHRLGRSTLGAQHIAEVVARPGVARVRSDRLAQRLLGLRQPPLLLERQAQVVEGRREARPPFERRPRRRFRFGRAAPGAQHLRQMAADLRRPRVPLGGAGQQLGRAPRIAAAMRGEPQAVQGFGAVRQWSVVHPRSSPPRRR